MKESEVWILAIRELAKVKSLKGFFLTLLILFYGIPIFLMFLTNCIMLQSTHVISEGNNKVEKAIYYMAGKLDEVVSKKVAFLRKGSYEK